MRLVDLDTKVTTWRYNFDKEEYVAVQTTVGEMIDLNTHEGLSIPIVEIPEPHGRLIDADKLKSYWEPDHSRYFDADYFIHTIDVAQTIIPASKEG